MRADPENAPAPRKRESRIWRDLAVAFVSVIVSAAAAFFVAQYTARETSKHQHATELYLPMQKAVAHVVTCMSPTECSEHELLTADRRFRNSAEIISVVGTPRLIRAVSRAEEALGRLVRARIDGRKASQNAFEDASRKGSALQRLLDEELS
jgi:hypothetical protein